MVGDVDGDGVRELVRLVPWNDQPGASGRGAWSRSTDGQVADHGEALLQRTATTG